MADKEISDLTAASALGGTEIAHIVQGGNSRETDIQAIADLSSTKGQQTIWVPAGALTPTETNGAELETSELATNDVMAVGLLFDASTVELAQFAILMPKSWNEGTIIGQFVWMHPATTTNFGVVFSLAAVAFANDDALDTAFGTAVTATDTGGTTSDCYITPETGAMTVAGSPGAEELVVFQVTRVVGDGGDTMAVDAKLLGIKLHYTTDAEKDD